RGLPAALFLSPPPRDCRFGSRIGSRSCRAQPTGAESYPTAEPPRRPSRCRRPPPRRQYLWFRSVGQVANLPHRWPWRKDQTVVDLAAMRDAMLRMGGDPARINPLLPAELVIDHSVQVDAFGTTLAFRTNAELEFARNRERYAFLRWGQTAFRNFRVVPPDTGIVHQVTL